MVQRARPDDIPRVQDCRDEPEERKQEVGEEVGGAEPAFEADDEGREEDGEGEENDGFEEAHFDKDFWFGNKEGFGCVGDGMRYE